MTVSAPLRFVVRRAKGAGEPHPLSVTSLILAGYTGRDRAAVLAHIAELEKAGVAPPTRVPSVFIVPPSLTTIAPEIAVASASTSGEAEFVLISTPEGRLVGIGSDHTDRAMERVDIDAAKAACPKVIGRDLWRYEDVSDHWDALEIRSWSTLAGQRRIYQEGTLAQFMDVERLIREMTAAGEPEKDGRALFGGTLPLVRGDFEYGDRFEAQLRDPVRGRVLRLLYDVRRAA